MASLRDLLAALGPGRLIPIFTRSAGQAIRTRRGGGIGDPIDPASAEQLNIDTATGKYRGRIDWEKQDPDALIPIPPEDYTFDESRMIPFISSNVEGGYFTAYPDPIRGQPTEFGNMFLLFQKRRPEVPGGKPIGTPRAYLYQNCPEYIWDAIFEAASHGGAVHDLVIRGGVAGDRVG